MNELKNHWENIYNKTGDQDLSWFQAVPEKSIQLIEKYSASKQHKIIDIGGGNSNLSKELCCLGYKNFSVLDISEEAIERCRAKLRKCKGIHELIASNILEFNPLSPYQIWHDRAVFHYLIEPADIKKYIAIASKNIIQKGYLILSTFSISGPSVCSGLPVTRYSTSLLEKLFSDSFLLLETLNETHITPIGILQDFVWVVLQRN